MPIKTIANPYGGRSEHATPAKYPRRRRIPQGPYLEKAPNQTSLDQGRKKQTSSRIKGGKPGAPRDAAREGACRGGRIAVSTQEKKIFLIRGT